MLRAPTAADAAPFVRAFADDADLARAMGYDAPEESATRKSFRRERRDRHEGSRARFVVEQAERFAGLVSLHSFAWEHRRAGLGVMLVPRARGRGAALEAVRLLKQWGFEALGLQRVELHTLPDNLPTQRLAERAGFVREGVLHAYTREWERPMDNVISGAWA